MLDGQERGGHVAPDEPRVIIRWDGYQWVPESIADNYTAAQRILCGIEGDGVMRDVSPPAMPRKARGRHRKP